MKTPKQSDGSRLSRVIKSVIPLLFGRNFGWILLRMFRPVLAVALRNTTFTCEGKNDGGGAQIQAIASVAAVAKFFGARFVHTRLSSIEHCPQGVSMEEFCLSWERIVSLFGFSLADTRNFEPYDTMTFMVDFLMFRTRGKSISLEHAHFLTDNHPEIYEIVGISAPGRRISTVQTQKIYAHARRGDVKSEGSTSFRHTSDEKLRSYIETVRGRFPAISEVFIVTENPDSMFIHNFSDCTIITEEDPVKVILLLAKADVLIMGKSAFSYVAALLSTGLVFYEKYWQLPLPSWITLPDMDS